MIELSQTRTDEKKNVNEMTGAGMEIHREPKIWIDYQIILFIP